MGEIRTYISSEDRIMSEACSIVSNQIDSRIGPLLEKISSLVEKLKVSLSQSTDRDSVLKRLQKDLSSLREIERTMNRNIDMIILQSEIYYTNDPSFPMSYLEKDLISETDTLHKALSGFLAKWGSY